MKKLEDELDIPLFERSKSTVQVTPLGEKIVAQAQRVLEQSGLIYELASAGTFLPLVDIDGDDQALAGIPTLELTLSGGGPAPVVFIGIGIKRERQAVTILVNDQLRPVRDVGKHTLDLNGIATRLQAGDRVGLLVYGYHPQFLASFSGLPGHVDVSGHVGLPLVSISRHRLT